jgi:hypothetical protein
VPERDRTADLKPARRDDRTAPAPRAIAQRHGARTDREICRGGIQTGPASTETAREMFSGSSAHPPRRIVRDVNANAILRLLVANNVLLIATLPPDGRRLLRQGGFETRPPHEPRSIHDIGPCLLLCIRPLMALRRCAPRSRRHGSYQRCCGPKVVLASG